MRIRNVAVDCAVEIDRAIYRYAEATAAYMVRLEEIVGSLTTLTTGSHGFDYAVSVRQSDIPRILPLLADLTFDIDSEFDVTIKTDAVARVF